MPGESPAIFGDALRRLAGTATYLYQDGARYWYSTQPTVTKLAEDRAEQLNREPDKVAHELEKRLRLDLRKPGDFSRIHPMPHSGQDVPDDFEARLVVLGIDRPYSKEPGNAAETFAKVILESRGNTPRLYRNTLVFLAADTARLQDLAEATRKVLAWESILAEKIALNLDPQQVKQAEEQKAQADAAVIARDKVPLWRGNHVPVKQLAEDFARYLYLPRLKDSSVLIGAIRDGMTLLTWQQESFAYADSFDEGASRYRGLRGGQGISLADTDLTGLVVKGDAARAQLDAESTPAPSAMTPGGETPSGPAGRQGEALPGAPNPVAAQPKRFHGTVTLDTARVGRDAGRIAEEVIAHLSGLLGARVTVTLEIAAEIPSGAPDHVVRTVTENSRTLRFTSQGFEVE
jgi:hypothetical protein